MTDAPIYLCVDLGGTIIKAGVVQSGRVVAGERISAHSEQGLAPQLERIVEMLERTASLAGTTPQQCGGIGIAIPTLVDRCGGRLLAPMRDKYADAMKLDLHGWAQRAFNLKLRLENDARAALLGEWKFGAGRGCDDVVMVTLGTGIGTAVVMDGKPLLGRHSQAGVLGGHFVMSPHGSLCGCGGRGCVESEAGAPAVERLARADACFDTSRLAQEQVVSFESIFRNAETGDSLALRLRDHCLSYWGAAVVSLIHAFDPQRVILGGGVMKSSALVLRALRKFVDERAWTPWGQVEIKSAELGDNAALVGMGVALSATVQEAI